MENKTYVVVGNSPNLDRYWYRIYKDLKKYGLKVYCVNPKIAAAEGETFYPDLESLPVKPDSMILVTRPDISAAMVDKAIEMGYKEIWFQPGACDQDAAQKARQAGLSVYEDCFMLYNDIW